MNIVDEFTRETVTSHVVRSIGARDVVAALAKTFEVRGKPANIRSDYGREVTANTVVGWLTVQDEDEQVEHLPVDENDASKVVGGGCTALPWVVPEEG